MAKILTTQCDNCGTCSGASNNWFSLYFRRQGPPYGPPAVGIVGSDQECPISDADEEWDLCGAECVARKVSELLPKLRTGGPQ